MPGCLRANERSRILANPASMAGSPPFSCRHVLNRHKPGADQALHTACPCTCLTRARLNYQDYAIDRLRSAQRKRRQRPETLLSLEPPVVAHFQLVFGLEPPFRIAQPAMRAAEGATDSLLRFAGILASACHDVWPPRCDPVMKRINVLCAAVAGATKKARGHG